jgi:hypothetical protein
VSDLKMSEMAAECLVADSSKSEWWAASRKRELQGKLRMSHIITKA